MKVGLGPVTVMEDVTSLCSVTVMVEVTSLTLVDMISNDGLQSDADEISKLSWRSGFQWVKERWMRGRNTFGILEAIVR